MDNESKCATSYTRAYLRERIPENVEEPLRALTIEYLFVAIYAS